MSEATYAVWGWGGEGAARRRQARPLLGQQRAELAAAGRVEPAGAALR